MEVPNTSTNNSNGSSSVDVPVQTTQKIRITIAPNAGGFSISVMPRDSPVEVVHGHEGHGHRGGPHCPRSRGMFPYPGMLRRCHQSPDSSAATPVHGGPHHHHRHFPHWRSNSPYAAELEQFKSEGFHCVWWIEKLLIMYNGNVEEVRQVLNRKKNKKEAARQKWATELAQLHQIGFERDWVNLRLLKKFDGDLEQTLNKLMDYQNHINKAFTGPTEAELLKYKIQLEVLHEAGHHRDRFLIYWLNRFDGNVDAVLAKLQKKQDRREAKMAKYAPQLEQLRQAGHSNDRCNARLLKAADGDIEKVLRVLNSKSSCPMRPGGGWGRRFGAAAAESAAPADTESNAEAAPGCSGIQEEGETLEDLTSFPWEFGGFPHHRRHHGHHGHHGNHGPYNPHHHGPYNRRGGHHHGHHGHHGHGPHHPSGMEHGPHHFGGAFGFPNHFGMPHCPSGRSFPEHGPFGMGGCPFGEPFQGEGHSPFSHPHPHHGHFGGAHFAHRGPQPCMFPAKAEGEDFRC